MDGDMCGHRVRQALVVGSGHAINQQAQLVAACDRIHHGTVVRGRCLLGLVVLPGPVVQVTVNATKLASRGPSVGAPYPRHHDRQSEKNRPAPTLDRERPRRCRSELGFDIVHRAPWSDICICFSDRGVRAYEGQSNACTARWTSWESDAHDCADWMSLYRFP